MVESRLDFTFDETFHVVKFDSTDFYKMFYSSMPNGKGVDFIADSEERLIFMEVKNCAGYESDAVWRTQTDHLVLKRNDKAIDESFDIEVSKKVLCTIACLFGANSRYRLETSPDELRPFFHSMSSAKYSAGSKRIEVILFLEGDFGSKSRPKKIIMKRIQEKIAEKLKWLNCTVRVVDSNTYKRRYFEVRKAG